MNKSWYKDLYGHIYYLEYILFITYQMQIKQINNSCL